MWLWQPIIRKKIYQEVKNHFGSSLASISSGVKVSVTTRVEKIPKILGKQLALTSKVPFTSHQCAFCIPQFPFAFEIECEWLNVLCVAKLPFSCSEIFMPFYWKWLNGNLARHFKIKNIYIFECEWPNGNSNDLCTAKLPFGRSHWNSNTNGIWGIQNTPTNKLSLQATNKW